MTARLACIPMTKSFKGRRVLPKESSDSWYSRGYFPHFDGARITQHVCFHLYDSLPQSLLAQWREELRRETARKPRDDVDMNREWRRRIHEALDKGYGSCFLRDHHIAEMVENALLHFDDERYAYTPGA